MDGRPFLRQDFVREVSLGELDIPLPLQADEPMDRPPPALDMIWISGGTFRMGSDRHYREEAPVHRVSIDGFWIDRTPVTNRQFKEFIKATGHVTFAELVPDANDYPGTLPHMIFAGSLVFTPPRHPVDLRDSGQWWTLVRGADWRHPYGPKSRPPIDGFAVVAD